MAKEFWTKGEVRGGVDTIYEGILLKTGTLVLMFIPAVKVLGRTDVVTAVKVHPRILSGTTRKRGRDDDPAEEKKEDNGKKLVKEEKPERTRTLALPYALK